MYLLDRINAWLNLKPAQSHFLDLTFTNPAGTRPYKLFVPSGYTSRKLPLILMLHGCSQTPDDFARGTGMNAAAEAATCLVAYPAQTTQANGQKCRNWFTPANQARGSGEASILAGITHAVIESHAVDTARIYVAGLSAGGAAAAILAQTYPDLFAAAGIHSGVACGAATTLSSALHAMAVGASAPPSRSARIVPTIVFHGDCDTTVNIANAEAVLAQALKNQSTATQTQTGQFPLGHAYTRTIYGRFGEFWKIHGGTHAWFGGNPAGSFTDPLGPSATREMLRFFQQHHI
jgi:poly(hydroxyalkanoate) depolymerase family esterase